MACGPSDGEQMAALAQAFDAAQDAVEALAEDDDMRVRVLDELLRKCTSAVQLQRIDRGNKPSICDRQFWYERLGDDDSRKPQRANAYDAMNALLALVWLPMSKAESKKRQRADPAFREKETHREVQRQHEVKLAAIDRDIHDEDVVRLKMHEQHRKEYEASFAKALAAVTPSDPYRVELEEWLRNFRHWGAALPEPHTIYQARIGNPYPSNPSCQYDHLYTKSCARCLAYHEGNLLSNAAMSVVYGKRRLALRKRPGEEFVSYVLERGETWKWVPVCHPSPVTRV